MLARCLHATDAVTVFLSIQARSDGVATADIERALDHERSLVRMLATRRTLGPCRATLPFVFAAATKAVAATQRKRL